MKKQSKFKLTHCLFPFSVFYFPFSVFSGHSRSIRARICCASRIASAIAQTYAGLFFGAVAIRRAASIDAASNNAIFRRSSTPPSLSSSPFLRHPTFLRFPISMLPRSRFAHFRRFLRLFPRLKRFRYPQVPVRSRIREQHPLFRDSRHGTPRAHYSPWGSRAGYVPRRNFLRFFRWIFGAARLSLRYKRSKLS